MKKRYQITLSPKDEKVQDKSLREIEIELLSFLFGSAANEQKDVKMIYSALDSAGRVENLKDDENLIIDDEDIGFIKTAVKSTAGKRTGAAWILCRNLFSQLANPVEIE